MRSTKYFKLRVGSTTADQDLIRFVDTDWADDVFTIGNPQVIMYSKFGGGTISWASRKQSNVILLSTEAVKSWNGSYYCLKIL